MKGKKSISLLLTGSMAICLLAGCSNAGNQETASQKEDLASEKTTEDPVLKVAVFEGGYGTSMWTDVVAAFEASHPGITVELTIDKKIEDVISPSMKAGDYPDVVHLATGREAGLTETLTKEKALLPLTDVLDMMVPGRSEERL